MLRPGPTNLNRPAMLALAMLVWFALPLGNTPAQAAGCHVPDRPALGVNPPGHHEPHLAAWVLPDAFALAPPVLKRIPCPGETPQSPGISTVHVGTACIETLIRISATRPRPFLALDLIESPDPFPFRLDRPPR